MPATKTQLTGGVFQDSQGNVLANGYLIFSLNQDNSVSGVCSIAAGIEIKVLLNSSGSVSTSPAQYIWATDVMGTANAYYRVTGYTAQGQPAWGPNNQQVTSSGVGGGTFDVGTWVPNSVFSWTPSNQPVLLETNTVKNSSQILLNLIAGSNITLSEIAGAITVAASVPSTITLKTNGTSNGSQTILNLKNGSNVTVSDDGVGGITIAATGAQSFGTAGNGWLAPTSFLPFTPSKLDAGACSICSGTVVVNQVGAVQFILPYAVTIRSIAYYVVTGAGSGYASTAIYDSTGTTKLVDAGANAFDTHTASQVLRIVNITPVTLPAGLYWWATASTDGNGSVLGYINMYQFLPPVVNANVVRYGSAANSMSAGAMPASLGAVTGWGTSGSCTIPHIMFLV